MEKWSAARVGLVLLVAGCGGSDATAATRAATRAAAKAKLANDAVPRYAGSTAASCEANGERDCLQ